VIIVVGRVRNEKEYPNRTPRKIIAAMSFSTFQQPPGLPEKESEAVSSIPQEHKWN
jgi:hypothetical protein